MSRSRRSAARSMCEAPRDDEPRPEAGRAGVSPVPPGVPGRVAGVAPAMDSVARPPAPVAPCPALAEPGTEGPDA